MTSATTEPVKGTGRPRGEGHGLIVFASVLLVIVGWAVRLRQPRDAYQETQDNVGIQAVPPCRPDQGNGLPECERL